RPGPLAARRGAGRPDRGGPGALPPPVRAGHRRRRRAARPAGPGRAVIRRLLRPGRQLRLRTRPLGGLPGGGRGPALPGTAGGRPGRGAAGRRVQLPNPDRAGHRPPRPPPGRAARGTAAGRRPTAVAGRGTCAGPCAVLPGGTTRAVHAHRPLPFRVARAYRSQYHAGVVDSVALGVRVNVSQSPSCGSPRKPPSIRIWFSVFASTGVRTSPAT